MGKSIQELGEELSQILSHYGAEGPQLARLIRPAIKPTILLSPGLETSSVGRLGGSPKMPKSMRWPETRQGEKLLFVAQLDLNAIFAQAQDAIPAMQPLLDGLPRTGNLLFFRTAGRASENIKDRYGFAVLYTSEAMDSEHMQEVTGQSINATATALYAKVSYNCLTDCLWLDTLLSENFPALATDLLLKENLLRWLVSFNGAATEGAIGQIKCINRKDLDTLRHMASFSASGVGFSEDRKDDWHYKHLAQEASNFELLFTFVEIDQDSMSCVLMRKEDLLERKFERAWLFCRSV